MLGFAFSKQTLPITDSNTTGKRIALPTRVEPKVFFANERTFLSWLNFTVILGGLAVGLLNFGDAIGRISAGLFTLVAMGAMVYALVTFHWRARTIRQRGQSGFDDRYGPSILAVALLAAVVVNFVLRVTAVGKGDEGGMAVEDLNLGSISAVASDAVLTGAASDSHDSHQWNELR